MIRKIIEKMKLFSEILKIEKEEPNDYTFGSKVRTAIWRFKEKISK